MYFDSPRDYIEWVDLLTRAKDHPGNKLPDDLLNRKSGGWLKAYIERMDIDTLAQRIKPYTVEEV